MEPDKWTDVDTFRLPLPHAWSAGDNPTAEGLVETLQFALAMAMPFFVVYPFKADRKEMHEESFTRTLGARIPSDEVPGMTFWWLK